MRRDWNWERELEAERLMELRALRAACWLIAGVSALAVFLAATFGGGGL